MSKTQLFSQICFCFLCPLLDIWMSIHASFCHLPSRYYWWANPANYIFFTFLLAVFSTSLTQFIHFRNTLLAVVYAGLCSRWLRCISQFSLAPQSCPTLCDPMDYSTPSFPVHHQLLEPAQTHVHRVGDAIQPSYPLLSPSPPAFSLSQHVSDVSMNNSKKRSLPSWSLWWGQIIKTRSKS